MRQLFEVPDVWKKLRNLSLGETDRGSLRSSEEDRIIRFLPSSLAYLGLNANFFDISSLADLKASPLQITFRPYRYFNLEGQKELDVSESLRILND